MRKNEKQATEVAYTFVEWKLFSIMLVSLTGLSIFAFREPDIELSI